MRQISTTSVGHTTGVIQCAREQIRLCTWACVDQIYPSDDLPRAISRKKEAAGREWSDKDENTETYGTVGRYIGKVS